jgi:hypothetical protein
MHKSNLNAEGFAPPGRLFNRRALRLSNLERVRHALYQLGRTRARLAELSAFQDRGLERLEADGLITYWDHRRWETGVFQAVNHRESELEDTLAALASACSPKTRPFGAVIADGKLIVDVREVLSGEATTSVLILDVADIRNLDRTTKGGR